MKSANLTTPNRPVSFRSGVTGLLLFCLVLYLPGCKQDPAEPAEVKPDETIVISLETTFQGLNPEEFGINVPRDLPTSDINEWGDEMLVDMVDPEVDEKELSESLSKILPEDVVKRVIRSKFVLRDANHIRDSLWARKAAESITVRSKSELDAVVDLFYFVVNTVRVVPAAGSLPFGPFESTLYGFGTAEDRAWVFATLLRQRRIPSIVFVEKQSSDADDLSAPLEMDAKKTSGSTATNLIVGVLLDDAVYLFDSGLGLPIASSEDHGTSPLIRQPATLSKTLADASILAKMGTEEATPYAITLEKFKQLQPLIIGDSSVWSRRMEGLRNGQPVDVKALIFEPLVSCGPYKGLVETMSEHFAKVLPEASVGVWLYPEQQRETRESVSQNKELSKRLASVNDTFKVPQPISVEVMPDEKNPGKKKLTLRFGASWGTHRRGRVDQILGQPRQAIPAYLKVQNWRAMPPTPDDEPIAPHLKDAVAQQLPADVKQRHLNAAEEALVWRATCQIQKGAHSSAAVTLEEYLRQLVTGTFPGKFRNEANYLAGLSLALSDNNRRGAAFLRKIDPQDSRYSASRWLIDRWTKQNEKAE